MRNNTIIKQLMLDNENLTSKYHESDYRTTQIRAVLDNLMSANTSCNYDKSGLRSKNKHLVTSNQKLEAELDYYKTQLNGMSGVANDKDKILTVLQNQMTMYKHYLNLSGLTEVDFKHNFKYALCDFLS